MENQQPIIENSSDSFLIIRKRKPRFEIPETIKEFKISEEQDFVSIKKIAHAYAKDYDSSSKSLESFKQLGSQIGKDFQFGDTGAGADTLSGQLSDNTVENRDCKLPTFLLAATWNEIQSADAAKITFLNNNLAHPYVEINTDGKKAFGHFTKPRPEEVSPKSQFELLGKNETSNLERFIENGRTTSFSIDSNGMAGIDEMFIRL